MNGYCAYCGKQLTTGDFNGMCQECRQRGHSELKDLETLSVKTSNNTKQPMIKLGDTFKADGNVWEVTKIDEEGVSIETTVASQTYLINICPLDEVVWIYRKFKNGNTRGIWWNFSFDEIKMVNKIVEVMYV